MNSKRQLWSATEIKWLIAHYPNHKAQTLADVLGRTIQSIYRIAKLHGVKKSATFLASTQSGRTNGQQGQATRFRKGQASHTKGTKGVYGVQAGCRATQFKPGQKPHNFIIIGTLRTRTDGYLERKVSDTGYGPTDWQIEHRLLWEAANGPTPKGHVFRFINGDKTDVRLENIACISRYEHRRLNIGLIPKALMDVHRLRGTLTREINRARKNHV